MLHPPQGEPSGGEPPIIPEGGPAAQRGSADAPATEVRPPGPGASAPQLGSEGLPQGALDDAASGHILHPNEPVSGAAVVRGAAKAVQARNQSPPPGMQVAALPCAQAGGNGCIGDMGLAAGPRH